MTKGADDAAPLLVANYFAIGQSNAITGGSNDITVTLVFGVALAAGDKVTISGLTGTTTADASAATGLALLDASGGSNDQNKFKTVATTQTAAKGDWVKSTGTLTMESA